MTAFCKASFAYIFIFKYKQEQLVIKNCRASIKLVALKPSKLDMVWIIVFY